ncbi:MAG: N-acetyl-gamma-glutamyl-phosphate reductase [Paramuribaculum sp.]|nr:N-acetyl-gamma-glutamyl-phosphate reductase [Paramuribaculum sp.]
MKIGIIGGAGYTAGELIRILLNHPEAEIAFVQSSSNAGRKITDIHEGLIGETDLVFSEGYDLNAIDVLFLCGGHGKSTEFWKENKMPDSLKVIDLAQDFRDESDGYVYGLPEVNLERIKKARKVANPGCFATAIQLSLLPLAAAGKLSGDINITGITGSTGAGVKPGATTHFSWRVDNMSVYKVFNHQHLIEINRTIDKVQPGNKATINFVPVRGDFSRGIFAMSWLRTDMSEQEVRQLYADFYQDAPFTFIADGDVDLKQAVNTNKAIIGIKKVDDKLLITCAIDNLLKGASGQAVQNMNIIFGLPEEIGLKLKPSAF